MKHLLVIFVMVLGCISCVKEYNPEFEMVDYQIISYQAFFEPPEYNYSVVADTSVLQIIPKSVADKNFQEILDDHWKKHDQIQEQLFNEMDTEQSIKLFKMMEFYELYPPIRI